MYAIAFSRSFGSGLLAQAISNRAATEGLLQVFGDPCGVEAVKLAERTQRNLPPPGRFDLSRYVLESRVVAKRLPACARGCGAVSSQARERRRSGADDFIETLDDLRNLLG